MVCCFFFFKQKTAYEMRISDWSSDVCSSDLCVNPFQGRLGEHACRSYPFSDRCRACDFGHLYRLFRLSRGRTEMRCTSLFAVLALPALLTACGSDPDAAPYGPEPKLPDRQRGLLPSMEIANPAKWGDQRPMAPQGYTITPVATDLENPRQTIVLPNGDILDAEGKSGGQSKPTPKDVIAGYIQAKGTSTVKRGNSLTLLRDQIGRA